MKTIWKFNLSLVGEQVVYMQEGAQILNIQIQYENPVIWALVDLAKIKSEPRRIRMLGTGWSQDHMDDYRYISTIQLKGDVWHFFVRYEDDMESDR